MLRSFMFILTAVTTKRNTLHCGPVARTWTKLVCRDALTFKEQLLIFLSENFFLRTHYFIQLLCQSGYWILFFVKFPENKFPENRKNVTQCFDIRICFHSQEQNVGDIHGFGFLNLDKLGYSFRITGRIFLPRNVPQHLNR